MPLLMTMVLAANLAIPTIPVADSVPKFDIARNCRVESPAGADPNTCIQEEQEALTELQNQWTTFGAVDKVTCTKETSMDGTPSYVELLTCVEMARDARNLK